MSNYLLVTDSACEFTGKMICECDVKVLPITYTLDGKEYPNTPDHDEYPIKDFYQKISSGAPVSTAAINQETIREFLEPIVKEGNDVIYLTFSSGLSSIFNNAVLVARELCEEYPGRKVTAVDSLSASNGMGLLVWLAAKKRLAGASYDELVQYIEEIRPRVCHEFTVDDLGQLKRGGRISPATAFVGAMLQVKPMLYIPSSGKLVSYGKARGRKLSIKMLADKIIGECDRSHDSPIFIGHGDCQDDVDMLIDMLKAELPQKEIFVNYIGPVIGAHSGYKTLSVFCISESGRGEEREDK